MIWDAFPKSCWHFGDFEESTRDEFVKAAGDDRSIVTRAVKAAQRKARDLNADSITKQEVLSEISNITNE